MNTDTVSLYKPIQYLGAKTRALDTIVSESKRLHRKGSYIVDLFSGSGIVSEAYYHKSIPVIANDVLKFCTDITNCLLNISKTQESESLLRTSLIKLDTYTIATSLTDPFQDFIVQESKLLNDEDLKGLKNLYSHLPLVGQESVKPSQQVLYIKDNIGKDAFFNVPLVANYYAGSYFGIYQSLRIDVIRNYIESVYNETHDLWVYTTMLTALYSCLSTIVHSAGKHFAQPISITDLDKNKITNKRLFENRKYDVDKLFIGYIEQILSKTKRVFTTAPCISLSMDICDKDFESSILKKDISVIYADPPYTAQQYSRFYHIPEVIRDYRYPQLQYHNGHITQGLYPDNKYKSDFCSATKAKNAFKSIFSLVRRTNSSLILSYSESKKEETGNKRMVTLDDILSVSNEYLPNYKIKQQNFDFDYKQLNTTSKVVQNKEDKEFLIIFEKK